MGKSFTQEGFPLKRKLSLGFKNVSNGVTYFATVSQNNLHHFLKHNLL